MRSEVKDRCCGANGFGPRVWAAGVRRRLGGEYGRRITLSSEFWACVRFFRALPENPGASLEFSGLPTTNKYFFLTNVTLNLYQLYPIHSAIEF